MAPFHWSDEILRLPITDYRLIVDPALGFGKLCITKARFHNSQFNPSLAERPLKLTPTLNLQRVPQLIFNRRLRKPISYSL